MSEVRIPTPRGVTLAGTFVNPVDSSDAAVVFSHSFLADRHSGSLFDRLAAAYRGAGYATVEFDYSGCGESDDDVIVAKSAEEDLHSVCSWMVKQGFSRLIIHAHSFGTIPALMASPAEVRTMVLTGLISGPISFDWEAIFSPSQLDDLERDGTASIPDDSPSSRESFTISSQTLIDLSMTRSDELLKNLTVPILVIHDYDDETTGLVEMTRDVFPLLPDGSHLEVVHDHSFGAHQGTDILRDLSLDWVTRHVPPRSGQSR